MLVRVLIMNSVYLGIGGGGVGKKTGGCVYCGAVGLLTTCDGLPDGDIGCIGAGTGCGVVETLAAVRLAYS